MATMSGEEVRRFHRRDREVIRCLLVTLGRRPAESLLIMALWLWLENIGYPSVIAAIANLANPRLISAMAKEALSCLRVLEAENLIIPPNGGLPITSALMQREISLQLFNLTRFTAISGVRNILEKVCAPAFNDIIKNYFYRNNTFSVAASGSTANPFRCSVVPGFPHPLFGNFTIPAHYVHQDFFNLRLWNSRRSPDLTSKDDRTMFLTFSRGFPVSEKEVRVLFKQCFGDVIVELTMGNVKEDEGHEQILFATMVVNTSQTVKEILRGKRIAKFRVNGKHIWARKYARRQPN